MIKGTIPSKVVPIVIRITKYKNHIAIQFNVNIGIINNIYTESDNRVWGWWVLDNVNNCHNVRNVHLPVAINITIGILRFSKDDVVDFLYIGCVNIAVAIHVTFYSLCINTHTKQHQ